MLKRVYHFLLQHEILIFILLFTVLLRIPSLHEPYWYGDEGIYLTLGNAIRHGLHLYKDIYDNKPPIIYFIAAIAHTQFWFRFILLVWNLATITVLSYVASRLLNAKRVGLTQIKILGTAYPIPNYSDGATLLFALLPFMAEGTIANGEIFMILPVLSGVALLLYSFKRYGLKNNFLAILAGICFSLGFLIKVPSLFDATAAGIFFFVLTPIRVWSVKKENTIHHTFRQKITTLLAAIFRTKTPYLFTAAFLLPILVTFVYYFAIGAGKAYLTAAYLQNIGYLSSWATGSHKVTASVVSSDLKNRAGILLLTTIGTIVFGTLFTPEAAFIFIWFAFTLFAVLLSGRPYPHYLIQSIPPLSLLFVLFVKSVRHVASKMNPITKGQELRSLLLLGACVAILVVSIIKIHFWNYSIPPYYQNYINYAITHSITRSQYLAYFDPIVGEEFVVAQVTVRLTTPSDRVFIWGDVPTYYALTQRLPPGRFTSAYHIVDLNGYDETYSALLQKPPKIIVLDLRYKTPFPHLYSLISKSYLLYTETEHFAIYIPKKLK